MDSLGRVGEGREGEEEEESSACQTNPSSVSISIEHSTVQEGKKEIIVIGFGAYMQGGGGWKRREAGSVHVFAMYVDILPSRSRPRR